MTVPAGRYECMKFTVDGLGNQTYWFARGVGLVKQSYTAGPKVVTWELTRYQPGT